MSDWEHQNQKRSSGWWVPWATYEKVELGTSMAVTRSERSFTDSPPQNQLRIAQDPTRTRTYYIIEQRELCNFLLFCFLDSNNKHIIAL